MSKQLKIVMAQVNLLVGDIQANTTKVIEGALEAKREHNADIVVFPELTLTGYPPEDLLLRPSLKPRIDKALQRIKDAALEIYVVIGYPLIEENSLYNALSLIKGSELLATYRKQHLPNYQVFDERRYFVEGTQACIAEIEGFRVAMTICEDMWSEGPTRQAAQENAQLLININASPFHRDKMSERLALLQKRARTVNCPIIYANLVGGQDELVFDGSSMAISASGECLVRSPSFQEGYFPVSLALNAEGQLEILDAPDQLHALDNTEESLYKALVLGVRDYAHKNGFKAAVLGLSGGVDSALTLAIAVDALGHEAVKAVMMPFSYTSQLSLDLAQTQATRLEVDYSVIPISAAYESFEAALEEEFAGLPAGVTEQNIQARCRGVILMAISNKTGRLVLTTGNKSEIAVGYCTLYGDMAGGFDVLKDVSKTMVYRLCHYRNALEEPGSAPIIPIDVIERAPSAELAPDQIDQDNLPPYDVLDAILELYIEKDASASQIIAQGYDQDTVRRVLRLVDVNEYKRRQSPVGVRLTQRGFGRDRRYPITSGWELGE
ncbi:MAG: NAD+ synthase [Gammaproteobacteria bacterium]